MNKLKIVTQTPALRCEVCHQSDLFDSQTNHCNRCQNISHLVNTLNRTPRRVDVRETATNNFFKIALFWLLTICGFPLALYISYLFLANGILAVVIAMLGGMSVGMLFTILTAMLIAEIYNGLKQLKNF